MNRNINPYQISLFDFLQNRGIATTERERESKRLRHVYNSIISTENLLTSWQEFLRGKKKRADVAEFSLHFLDNILMLRNELLAKTYKHGEYQAFKINDPKPRDIHKANVRDRLLHHAIYRILYPYFDRQFIHDSYSCRLNKGTHRAINRFRSFGLKVSKNNTKTCWVLKCDIRKFFASIDHATLNVILAKHIIDNDALWLFSQIIDSFHIGNSQPIGLPLGNLTSQLLVNVYMNEFDQFVKRKLKCKYYIRYADDFVVLHDDRHYVEKQLPLISRFLNNELRLSLHKGKVSIGTLNSGIDFLGWVNFPTHRVLRTSTKKRILKRCNNNPVKAAGASYLGLLTHGNAYKLSLRVQKMIDCEKADDGLELNHGKTAS